VEVDGAEARMLGDGGGDFLAEGDDDERVGGGEGFGVEVGGFGEGQAIGFRERADGGGGGAAAGPPRPRRGGGG
jgi:hypothetical protein